MTNTDNVGGLLPCPFCGEQPKSGWNGAGVPGMDDCGYWGIDCCNAFAHADTEEEATAQWNRRAKTESVGVLPLLQFAVFDEFGKGADDRVWDYGRRCFEAGKLCRASSGDAGGLPELPKPVALSIHGLQAPGRAVKGYTADQMRAYGKLCRAAPAGGECQHEWEPDSDVMNARYCPKCDVTQTLPRRFRGVGELERTGYIPAGSSDERDSAPAGSGEVDRRLHDVVRMWELTAEKFAAVGNDISTCEAAVYSNCAKELAALLRKLQQGAES